MILPVQLPAGRLNMNEEQIQIVMTELQTIRQTMGYLMESQTNLMNLLQSCQETSLNQSRLLLQLSNPQFSSGERPELTATVAEDDQEVNLDTGPEYEFDPIDLEIFKELGVLSGDQDTTEQS